MKKQATLRKSKFIVALSATAFIGLFVLTNSCNKSSQPAKTTADAQNAVANNRPAPVVQSKSLIENMTVGAISKSTDNTLTKVIFNENEEIFFVSDATLLSALQNAFNNKQTIKVTYNPWTASVLTISNASQSESATHSSVQVVHNEGLQIDTRSISDESLNNVSASGVINTTLGASTLTSVIPDMATAQLMFDYITHQCCAIPGPYSIDYCIPFQYCEDGCYARAHKMCWIINTKYNYATQKIFSFALGSDELSVQGQKWGGCCINWWFHVAPLVNIKTPSGTKAYVIDPAMFDQPVLLATWLHAQENPACGGTNAHVTTINIQPTSSYEPASFGETTIFITDPTYSATDATLVSYSPLTTCP